MSEVPWTVLRLLRWTADYLEKKGVESGRREAEDLLGGVLELDRLKLYLAFEQVPSPVELSAFRALVKRRGEREPLQYLQGSVDWAGLRLSVDKRALIPRPETEALALEVVRLCQGLNADDLIMDLGTGSGCIALALAKALPARVLATDASSEALDLARANASALGLEGKLGFEAGALFEPLQRKGLSGLAAIVSNPPYIPVGRQGSLQAEVERWEPHGALFAGVEGLDVLTPICEQAGAYLRAGGLLALECDEGQPAGLAQALSAQGQWQEVRVGRDPFNVERYLFARRA